MESSRETDPRLLLLHEHDNVYVLVRPLQEGETYSVEGHSHQASAGLGIGHKIARRDIAAGEKILKYGTPIGSAYEPIHAGEHVHLQNLKSDYLPTYTLDKDHKYVTASH